MTTELQEVKNLMMIEFEKIQHQFSQLSSKVQDLKDMMNRNNEESLNVGSRPVHINAGGRIFTVSSSIFECPHEPFNLFYRIFYEGYPVKETPSPQFSGKVYFVEIDPDVFKIMLNWLKFGEVLIEGVGENVRKELYHTCENFNMNNLLSVLSNYNQTGFISSSAVPQVVSCPGVEVTSEPLQVFHMLNAEQCNAIMSLPQLIGKTPQLLFKATRDGFTGEAFHANCDNKGTTITFVKSEHGYIFGGYTEGQWNGALMEHVTDPNSFLFSFQTGNNLDVFNVAVAHQAIYNYPDQLATFGGGFDFILCNNCNDCSDSYSNLGFTYKGPNVELYNPKTREHLAGSFYFKATEVETYQL